MKKIVIYSSNTCPYCISAKKLLENQNLTYSEKVIDNNLKIKDEMIELSAGKKTVPQIFFGKFHVGGYDDLEIIYRTGKLMSLLNEKKI
jgi:glutaredoxin 3